MRARSWQLSPDADVTGLVVAGWSLSHGFATLFWLNANLQERLGPDPASIAAQLSRGLVTLGEYAAQRLRAAQPAD